MQEAGTDFVSWLGIVWMLATVLIPPLASLVWGGPAPGGGERRP